MKRYKNISGHSGVVAYESGPNSIVVKFVDGSLYLYDERLPGREHVDAMKRRAARGEGLNTYISRFVRTSCTKL